MSNWPATLPQQHFLGASTQDDESRLVSAMDAGPALVRKRFTAFTQTVETPIVLTGTELAAFNTFYRVTLNQGADSFTWTDPQTDSSVTFRFKSAPKWQCIKSGPVASREWKATLSLEILP